MTKYKHYSIYKPSGVEWLGDVPDHWHTWKISHAFGQIGSGTTPDTKNLCFYGGDVPWVTTSELRESIIVDTSEKLTEDALTEHSALSLYPPGTLLIAMYGATIGRLGILGITACTNQACCALAKPRQLDVKFCFYWLWMRRNEIILLSSGGGQPNINQQKIYSIRIPAPPLQEQKTIAHFLDRETTRIDTLITKKRELIGLLEKKRGAIVTEAVTKGCDRGVLMKNGEVEWLSEVPVHWKIARLKFLAHSIQTGPFGSQLHSDDYSPGSIPVINPLHLNNGRIYPDFDVAIDDETWQRLSRHELQEGDIVFARRGEIGRCGLVTLVEAGWLCGTGSMRLRSDQNIMLPSFVVQVLSVRGAADQLLLDSVGSTMDNLNTKTLSNLLLPVPPIDEQEAIIKYLKQQTENLDGLMEKIKISIDEMAKYRQALITAAVTGKIDVREEVESDLNREMETSQGVKR